MCYWVHWKGWCLVTQLCPWNSLGQNTGVGSLSLRQGIFPTQGSRILGWVTVPFSRGSSRPRDQIQVSCVAGWILYQLSHQGSLRTLEWVVYPFSSGSSWGRNQTRASCIAGRLFTNWAMREALIREAIIGKDGKTQFLMLGHLESSDIYENLLPLKNFYGL